MSFWREVAQARRSGFSASRLMRWPTSRKVPITSVAKMGDVGADGVVATQFVHVGDDARHLAVDELPHGALEGRALRAGGPRDRPCFL
jgi:hypothetical protein